MKLEESSKYENQKLNFTNRYKIKPPTGPGPFGQYSHLSFHLQGAIQAAHRGTPPASGCVPFSDFYLKKNSQCFPREYGSMMGSSEIICASVLVRKLTAPIMTFLMDMHISKSSYKILNCENSTHHSWPVAKRYFGIRAFQCPNYSCRRLPNSPVYVHNSSRTENLCRVHILRSSLSFDLKKLLSST